MNLVKRLLVGDNPAFRARFYQLIQQTVNPIIREVEHLKREKDVSEKTSGGCGGRPIGWVGSPIGSPGYLLSLADGIETRGWSIRAG